MTQITTTLDQVTQKLQVRIDRARELNETLISDIQKQQAEFQSEMRSTVTSLKTLNSAPMGGFGIHRSTSEGAGSGGRESQYGGGSSGSQTGRGGKDKEKMDEGPWKKVENDGHRGNWKYRKLDLPQFDGTNPDGWILRAERYFAFYRLNDEEKLEAAVVGFDGDALVWYQWENRRRPIRRWEDMRKLILQKF